MLWRHKSDNYKAANDRNTEKQKSAYRMNTPLQPYRIGNSTLIVVLNKSKIPYSVVDNMLVYNGTRKKLSNLVAKLLKVNKPIFFNKYL